MKVLQISNYMYPHIGGIEQVTRDFANVLKSEGIDQKIICFNENVDDELYSCKRKETIYDTVDGIDVVRCGCIAKIASQSISLTFGRELDKIMRSFKPDIIIFHYPNPFQALYLLQYKKRDFHLALYWHLDITKQKTLRNLFYLQNLELIARAEKILGATPMHVDESAFSSYFGNKRYILPYMINEKSLLISEKEINRAYAIKEKYRGKTICFFIGRHVPYKGLTYLVKASKELGDEDVRFIVAGSGELTKELKAQAADDCKIEFIGKISDAERRSYLYACDIFCFPSITRNEGFGLALAEGMYYGKPAVTFHIDGSGVNYVNLSGVTGIECPNADYKAYSEAIRKLHRNEGLRSQYGIAARERVLNNFTATQFKNNVMLLINSLSCDKGTQSLLNEDPQ